MTGDHDPIARHARQTADRTLPLTRTRFDERNRGRDWFEDFPVRSRAHGVVVWAIFGGAAFWVLVALAVRWLVR